MLSYRSVGIRTLVLLGRLIAVTGSFWGWLCIWESAALGDPVALKQYLLYNEFLLVGIVFAAGPESSATGQRLKEFAAANRRTVRQGLAGVAAIVVIVLAVKETIVSYSFLVSYLPWLYLALQFSNYLLPRTLAKWAFSGGRQERVALAGTAEQAALLKP